MAAAILLAQVVLAACLSVAPCNGVTTSAAPPPSGLTDVQRSVLQGCGMATYDDVADDLDAIAVFSAEHGGATPRLDLDALNHLAACLRKTGEILTDAAKTQ